MCVQLCAWLRLVFMQCSSSLIRIRWQLLAFLSTFCARSLVYHVDVHPLRGWHGVMRVVVHSEIVDIDFDQATLLLSVCVCGTWLD